MMRKLRMSPSVSEPESPMKTFVDRSRLPNMLKNQKADTTPSIETPMSICRK